MLGSARKILIINLRYIGDTVWMYPFIRNLKMNLPHAEISALVNRGGEIFLDLLPDISEVIVFDRKAMKGEKGYLSFTKFLWEVRKKRFDAVFILSNSDRPTIIGFTSGAKMRIGFESDNWWRRFLLTKRSGWDADRNPHMIEYYLQALTDSGLTVYDRTLTINIPESVIKVVQAKFGISKAEGRKSVIVHPGARTRLRQWGSERFAEVIDAVSGECRVFLTGGPDERDIVQDVLKRVKKAPDIVTTDLSLLEFAALCSLSDLFVGNDSAPIHVAAATGLFVIGIYGPTLSKHCGPWTEKRALFDLSTLPCRQCRQDVCINEEEQACLKVITPAMIVDMLREGLRASS